jgi:hypothetical protein
LKADMKKVGDAMIADWVKQAGADGQAVLGRLQQVRPPGTPHGPLFQRGPVFFGVRHARGARSLVHLGRLACRAVPDRHAGDGAGFASSAGSPRCHRVPGADAYAGYCMAASAFLALAHTLRRGEHIRVTLILNHLGPKAQRVLESSATARAAARRRAGLVLHAPGACSRTSFHDISTGLDATPLWIPQLGMAAARCCSVSPSLMDLFDLLRRQGPCAPSARTANRRTSNKRNSSSPLR